MFRSEVSKICLVTSFYVLFAFSIALAAVSPDESTLVYYFGRTINESVTYNLSDANLILEHPNFNQKETHLFIHGWGENQSSPSVVTIVNAYLERKNINILTLNWTKASDTDYLTAALVNVNLLGPALADVLLGWYKAGLEPTSFCLIGHSLGAQLSGITGREVIKKSNNATRIYRMVALDAAFPLFVFVQKSVNKNDAGHVVGIHTDIGSNGVAFPVGDVDFWPNGGYLQPGCSNGFVVPFSSEDFCSHRRAWQLWAESVRNTGDGPTFYAFPARSYGQFLREGIAHLKDEAIEMGINTPLNASGNYYLKTNGEPPYALGFDGYNTS